MKNNPATSFLDFIREQGVVGLATGFILGGAVQALVRSLVDDILNPILGIFLKGSDSLANAELMINGSSIRYGNFLLLTIDFFIVAAVVFFVFKGLKLDKLDKKK